MHTGQAKIQNGNFKLIHEINLDRYETFINDVLPIINSQPTNRHILFPLLQHELQQIQELLHNLKPRHTKRSLNFLGSAWKWIAGNPDHDDFITIKEKVTDVLKNNNKQVIINDLYNERINNITRIQNEIQNLLKENNNVNLEAINNIQYRIKLVKEELENLSYAIHWAKLGIINTIILSKKEIQLAINTLINQKLPYATIEEALDFSEIKILTNGSVILYIINIPLTTETNYEQLLIKPVKIRNFVTEILFKEIIKKDQEIYGISKECKKYNNLSICKSNNIVSLGNDTCIPHLLNSMTAECNFTNSQHIPTIEEIGTGILLLNQFTGCLEAGNSTHNLNGTYLIKFNNITVNINGHTFISREVSSINPLPAILQQSSKDKKFRELLSLEMMKELHINNTQEIENLRSENDLDQFTTYGFMTVILMIFSVSTIWQLRKRKSDIKITMQKPDAPETGPTEASIRSLHPPEAPRQKFYDQPYF